MYSMSDPNEGLLLKVGLGAVLLLCLMCCGSFRLSFCVSALSALVCQLFTVPPFLLILHCVSAGLS